MNIIENAAAHWAAMADFRRDRERAKRYCYGRQWDDMIEVDGHFMKEEDYIRSQGNVPLKNNLIRRLVRSVLGVFRNQYKFPSAESLGLSADSTEDCAIYAQLLRNAEENMLTELHARTMEEFLISGMAVHRKSTAAIAATGEMPGCNPLMLRTDYVAPDTFFVDASARDFRGWDTRLVGQIHDIDLLTLCSMFARTRAEGERIRAIYAGVASGYSGVGGTPFGAGIDTRMRDFYTPATPGLCRVVEVWTREAKEMVRVHDLRSGALYKVDAEEGRRLEGRPELRLSWMVDEQWYYHFMAPDGSVLREGPSPLRGGGHPYVWRAYPFIDGEIHSFVADVIDQQRHTNRLITLYDWVLRSTAKGVLLFPESALPDGVEIDDISDQWSRFNGVILFRPKAGMPLPQQVTGNASQVGITDLLNIQLSMFEDVSGVSGALEGKLVNGSVSGKLYDQQTRQAMIALQDILETYNSFVREGARREIIGLRP